LLFAPLSAETFELSLDDGRIAARQAALAGQFEMARDFALALTQADVNDRAALIVLAAVQPRLGAAGDGRRAGARAYRLSETQDERYEAARLTALAAANERRFTLSQLWLRRAAVSAPDDMAFQQTQSDYRGIRILNPWSMNLGFSMTSSSNVNGGSNSEFSVIDGVTFPDGTPVIGFFSGSARALPGTSATLDIRATYALSRSEQKQTSITARTYARSVWLNDEAREIAPDSRNSDFGSQLFEVSIDHARLLSDAVLSAQTKITTSWFSGDLSAGAVRGRLGYGIATGQQTRLTFTGQIEQTYDPDPWTRDNTGGLIAAAVNHIDARGGRLTGSLTFSAQSSENLNERYETLAAQVGYAWADPVAPVQLSIAGGIAWSDFRDYTIIFKVPGGRQDTRIFGSLTAVFPDVDYAGFVPVMTLGFQDTQSNVSRFERDEYSLNIGVRSSF